MEKDRGCATPQVAYIIVLGIGIIISFALGVAVGYLFLGGCNALVF